jgi:hypothetical protein
LMASSMADISIGVKGLVELISISAVSKPRASPATALDKFPINERNATTEPTPIAIHKKKNKRRFQEERISRKIRLKIKFIKVLTKNEK